jgi:hypothetical protein
MGATDSGEPLHLVILIRRKFNLAEIQKNKAILLINNGIHAGEPDGIDATMQLFRDLARQNKGATEYDYIDHSDL